MNTFTRSSLKPHEYTVDQKATLGLSFFLLLAVNFTLNYLTHTYYSETILELSSPGFWLFWLNNIFLFSILIFTKRVIPWSWKDLGLARPDRWWKPLLASIITFGAILLFAKTLQPLILDTFGKHQNISHLYTINGNLPRLIIMLITVWITAAILEELIFRAFIINTLEILLGGTLLSTVAAVLISAVIFAGIHSYQGITGIFITGAIGIIFGISYILNGRRVWPIILVHGLVDTIMLINIYKS